MATRTRFGLKGKDWDSYLELVQAFPLASIRSDEHLDEAQKVMDRLLARGNSTAARRCTSMRSAI